MRPSGTEAVEKSPTIGGPLVGTEKAIGLVDRPRLAAVERRDAMARARSAAKEHAEEPLTTEGLGVCAEAAGVAHVPHRGERDPVLSRHYGSFPERGRAGSLAERALAVDLDPRTAGAFHRRHGARLELAVEDLVDVLRHPDHPVRPDAGSLGVDEMVGHGSGARLLRAVGDEHVVGELSRLLVGDGLRTHGRTPLPLVARDATGRDPSCLQRFISTADQEHLAYESDPLYNYFNNLEWNFAQLFAYIATVEF